MRTSTTTTATAAKRRRLAVAALAGAAAFVLAACATNPVTGRSQLLLVDEGQLSQASALAWQEVKQQTPLYTNPAAQARVRDVGLKIGRGAGLDTAGWEFVVFDSPERNAFVLPGGRVGVYRGLLELAQNDSQLATVIGHEVAHVTSRHAAERASQTTIAQLGLTAGQALGGSQNGRLIGAALGLGAQYGVLLPYSRLQESEADRIGLDYMVKAGFDPRQAVTFWERMRDASGGGRTPQFLSTHPDPDNRIRRLQELIAQQGY